MKTLILIQKIKKLLNHKLYYSSSSINKKQVTGLITHYIIEEPTYKGCRIADRTFCFTKSKNLNTVYLEKSLRTKRKIL